MRLAHCIRGRLPLYGMYRNPGAYADEASTRSEFDFRQQGIKLKQRHCCRRQWTYLVSQVGRVHGRVGIGFAKRGVATRVIPSVRDLVSRGGKRRRQDQGER